MVLPSAAAAVRAKAQAKASDFERRLYGTSILKDKNYKISHEVLKKMIIKEKVALQ